MENECEALPGVAYPGVRDNRSTVNTKTGYDDDDDNIFLLQKQQLQHMYNSNHADTHRPRCHKRSLKATVNSGSTSA